MITCYFDCKACGATNVEVPVRNRHEGEDIEHYVKETIGREVNHKHFMVSRGECESKTVDLKIPMPKEEGKGIGY